MALSDHRSKFHAGIIDKKTYIDEMYLLHERLFEYAHFIKQTDIASIEIQDNHLIMTSRTNGIKLLCEVLDKRAAPIEILNFDFYEKSDSDMIFRLLDKDMVFFDIGANIGWYSINVAKHDKSITVHAFEPIQKTFETLTKNISLNAASNIKLYNIGFSDNNQDIVFYLDPTSTVSASSRDLGANPDLQKVKATVRKLDDFFSENKFNQLDFIKCDVEGAELLVYKGGFSTLTKHLPIIFTEMLRKWSARFDYHPNDIITLLSNLGYSCFTTSNGELHEFKIMDDDTIQTNFFFLHQEKHASKIKELSK